VSCRRTHVPNRFGMVVSQKSLLLQTCVVLNLRPLLREMFIEEWGNVPDHRQRNRIHGDTPRLATTNRFREIHRISLIE
jgi:hypothetical protein